MKVLDALMDFIQEKKLNYEASLLSHMAPKGGNATQNKTFFVFVFITYHVIMETSSYLIFLKGGKFIET